MKPKIKWQLLIGNNVADCTYFAGTLNIFGLLFIIPFKVEFDSYKDAFRLVTSRFRQVTCGILHTVSILLLSFCGYHRCYYTGSLELKGFLYVIYALDFALCAVFALVVIKILWMDQSLIERFLNTEAYRSSAVPRYKVWMAVFSCVIIFVCDIQINRNADISQCDVFPMELSKQSFLIEFGIILFRWLLFIVVILSQLFIYIGEALCCTLAINMWQICKSLDGKLRWDTPFKQGIEIYNEHRETIDAVNSFSSALFFVNLMSSLVYYAQAPIVYFFAKQAHNLEKAIMLAYIFISLMIWGFAGKCHAETRKSIKKWVNRQQEKADESTPANELFKLAAISYNLDSDPIALSCSFFNVTYGFEASMLGLLISYNIIIFQMEEQGNAIKASPSVIQ